MCFCNFLIIIFNLFNWVSISCLQHQSAAQALVSQHANDASYLMFYHFA